MVVLDVSCTIAGPGGGRGVVHLPIRCTWDNSTKWIWVAVNQDRENRRKRPVLFNEETRKFLFGHTTFGNYSPAIHPTFAL